MDDNSRNIIMDLINQRFDDQKIVLTTSVSAVAQELKGFSYRLDDLDRKAQARDLMVQQLDTQNKAENVAIKQEIAKVQANFEDVQGDLKSFKLLVKAGWALIIGLGLFIGWITDMLHKVGLIGR